MEAVNLEEMIKFFNEGKSARVMPLFLLNQTRKGECVAYRGLWTNIKSSQYLDSEINAQGNIPILELGGGEYIAFHPDTGKRLGNKRKVYRRE